VSDSSSIFGETRAKLQGTPPARERLRLPGLDGLRGISIVIVMLAHGLSTAGNPVGEWFLPATTGVKIFFVLSGFLITKLLLDEQDRTGRLDLPRFYARRALRIVPPLAGFLGVMALLQVAGRAEIGATDWIAAATFTLNFIKHNWTIGHLWSLAVEEQFYLFFPLLLAATEIRGTTALGFAGIVILPALRYAATIHLPGTHINLSGAAQVWPADFIACGCVLAIAAHNNRSRRILEIIRQPWCAALAALTIVTIEIRGNLYLLDPAVGFAIAVIVWWGTGTANSLVGRILNARPLVVLGTISYSLYLWQQYFLLNPNHSLLTMFPLSFGFAISAGALSHWLTERPLNRIRRRLAAHGSGVSATPIEGWTERFVGDPALWIQPEDRREFSGDRELGFGLIERWQEARRLVTGPAAGGFDGGHKTQLYVHSTVHPLYEPEKAPHAIVEAESIVLDFSKLYRARTLRFRPRYKTGSGQQYHRYRPGALIGSAAPAAEFSRACERVNWGLRRRKGLRLDLFSREHFQDIFGSYRYCDKAASCAYDEVIEHPVLFVTREGDESRNIFHSAADFLNAFETALVIGASRLDLEVVMLDNAPPAPFDHLWRRIFAPRHGVRRVRDFAARRVLFRRAIFSPPGYHSLFFVGVRGENPVPYRVGLLDAFAGLVLRAHGIVPRFEPTMGGGPLRATLVVRRPYETHKYMARRLANEEACLTALRSAGLEAQAVDFARHPIEEQIRIASETDILVGVHGAGLTHLLWMPPHGGLLEVDPANGRAWRCFRHLAIWAGREVAVIDEQEHRVPDGTLVTVDLARFEAAARELAARIHARRTATQRSAPVTPR